jgi:hypothetical protein
MTDQQKEIFEFYNWMVECHSQDITLKENTFMIAYSEFKKTEL